MSYARKLGLIIMIMLSRFSNVGKLHPPGHGFAVSFGTAAPAYIGVTPLT